jgi:carboxyl-terminal processing protease
MARKSRLLFTIPVVVLVFAFGAGLLGPGAHLSAATPDERVLPKEMHLFAQALAAVEDNEAEKIDMDKAIYDGALPGMMRTLDPHSNFFDPKEYALLVEDQEGHYSGVGMEVTQRTGKTVVTAPFPGIAGMEGGDTARRRDFLGKR